MANKTKSIPPVAPPAPAPVVSSAKMETGLFVLNSFQYGVTIGSDTIILKLSDLADKSIPIAGDACQVKPSGDEHFTAVKISEVGETKDGHALEITIRLAE